IEVDRHAPGVPLAVLAPLLGLGGLEQAGVGGLFPTTRLALDRLAVVLLVKLGELLFALVGLQGGEPGQVAAGHVEMVWRLRQLMATVDPDDLGPTAEPGGVAGPQRIEVDADPGPDPAGRAPPVAQEDRDRRLRLPRLDPRRQLDRLAAIGDPDDVLVA